ncbi:MAG: oligosaccharide flippase family protein [Bacteroidia bacterium]|nr:oligosaccharide flippase family protein [Bacteroidia bacterium]
MGSIKKLLSDSIVYGLAGAISKSINIFLVPIYTRTFSPAEYGIINLATNFYTLIYIFCTLNLDAAVHRWFWESDQLSYKRRVVGSWLYSTLVFTTIISLCIFYFAVPLSKLILGSSNHHILFQYIALSIVSSLFGTYINTLFRIEDKAISLAVFNTVLGVLTAGITIFMVVKQGMGVEGVFLGASAAQLIMAVIATILIYKWLIPFYFDVHLLKPMLLYVIPGIPSNILYWILNNSVGYFIYILCQSKDEVGLFNIGAAIASLIALIVSTFQQAWTPFAMSIIQNENAKSIYARVLILYCAAIGLISMLVGMFTKEALILFTHPKYYEAQYTAVILVYSQIFIGLTHIGMIGSAIKKTILPLLKVLFVSACLFAVLCAIMVPVYGKEGAAVSTLIAQIMMPIYVFYRSQKDYYIPYNFRQAFLIILISMILTSAAVAITSFLHFTLFIQVLVKMLFLSMFLVFLFVTKTITWQDLKKLWIF